MCTALGAPLGDTQQTNVNEQIIKLSGTHNSNLFVGMCTALGAPLGDTQQTNVNEQIIKLSGTHNSNLFVGMCTALGEPLGDTHKAPWKHPQAPVLGQSGSTPTVLRRLGP